ncbi:MAG: Zinc-binding dehydrogenase [Chloroflexi bacterium]|nr:Zinc-binding dehydrogenase [Chloroflexota bacterium]
MRAVVLEQPGQPTRVEDLALDGPGPGEVLVRIAASGVCHSDLHVRDAEWERPGPIVLGHEGAGFVEAVGPGVASPRVGDLVALSWYYPCLRCANCQAGRQWLCSDTRALEHRLPDGGTRLSRADGSAVMSYLAIGTFAERTVVAADAAIPMPAGVAPEVAALIGCAVTTGVGAVLKTAQVDAGASVAVIGLGGVGLSVVMGAVLAGAGRIVAVDRVAEKLERARDLGATDLVLATDPEPTLAAIRAATNGGFGARASFEAFPFVDGSRRILGSNYGFAVAATDFPRYAELHLAGRLPVDRLIDARIGLDDVEDAFDRMRRGEGLRRVIVL